jgi:NADH:ubiquinone oxidoreductase subunit
LVKRGGWVKVGEEGNRLPYWVSRHSWLHYRVNGKPAKLEVRVMITWDDHWFITHLSEFTH